jgi:membrane peptidoglycan carboxypeptidase
MTILLMGKINVTKRGSSSRKLNVYSNLSHKRRTKKDATARKKAEYLASLPKHPVKRFIYRLHPKRFWGYWFSKKGAIMALKIAGVGILFMVLMVGALFAYYRKDLDQIRPGELAKRVQTTVTKYYDRNDKLLWEDKGDGNYKLVVDGDNISKYMKDATIAIEDKDFYQHKGISVQGLVRATVNNAGGGTTQGGSTLTQQLVKQVFFADEAQKRGLNGVPRKIKEVILAIEVERMYNKEQILNLYLNESPYGGRRNGVESGAQTYFGKTAKDLTLPEAALLASIPQNPAVFDPYNTDGHEELVHRQHIVLNNMADQGKITQKEADEAKKVAILDTIKPESDQYQDIKAPHFVLEVKKQLEEEYGIKTIRSGGLTVKTTLDLDAQTLAEQAVTTGAAGLSGVGADNISLSSIDVKTGQVVAMVGSVDYNKDVYGQRNSATSRLEPGSSIKPIADYAALFKQRDGVNYGPGSILKDENIDSIYCAGSGSSCKLRNYTGRFYGSVPIRQALAGSLNIPAVKAMQIAGVEQGLTTARDLGDASYCTDNNDAGLSSSIGGGCTVRQVEHANAYATLARGGVYKPLSYVLEIKNSSGEKLKSWTDSSKQAVDPQVAFMVTDILSDANARSITFGSQGRSYGFVVPGVTTATKTGTTENGNGLAKDSWMMSYSPAIATSVWSGNHDGSPMRSSDNGVVRRVTNDYMEKVHKNVYAAQGKWKSGDGFAQPAGIQKLTVNGRSDIWPSWYKKDAGTTTTKVVFDKVSKKKATACTPDTAKIEVDAQKTVDPVTKKDVLVAPDGYDGNGDDDLHKCEDVKPSVGSIVVQNNKTIRIPVTQGTHALQSIQVSVDGQVINNGSVSGSGTYETSFDFTKDATITVSIQDVALYDASGTGNYKK